MELVNSSQDGGAVGNILWNKVIDAKVCFRCLFSRVSNSIYEEVASSKGWPVIYIFIDSSLWVSHHALKGCKFFFIMQRKYERLGSGAIHVRLIIRGL